MISDDFRRELAELINKHSKESGSNTPDWLLAEYLTKCLDAFDEISVKREDWYGHRHWPGSDSVSSGPAKSSD